MDGWTQAEGLTSRSFLAICSCSSMFSALSPDPLTKAAEDEEPAAGAAAMGAGREAPPAPPSTLGAFCSPL